MISPDSPYSPTPQRYRSPNHPAPQPFPAPLGQYPPPTNPLAILALALAFACWPLAVITLMILIGTPAPTHSSEMTPMS